MLNNAVLVREASNNLMRSLKKEMYEIHKMVW